MRISHVTARAAIRRARGRLTDEAGSFLIEAMVSAVIVLIMGAGVLKMMDRGTQLSAQQKTLATGGTLAESEQENLRAYAQSKEGIGILSKLRSSTTRAVAGVNYSITSRTDWINDDSGDPNCTTAASSADYMKLTTSVTSAAFGNRPPVTLESLITPPARSFDENQGSLAVQVNNRSGGPVSGLTLNLTGPATMSDTTNANGCVLWGYLPAGSGYTVGASRGGYVEPDGSATISEPASVIGDQTANVNLEYDLAGGVRAAFTTMRTSTATATSPQKAMVENANATFVPRAFTPASSSLDTGLVLFPFASTPYTIYADSCAAARPPAANLGSALAPAGSSSASVTVQIPALNILVQNNGANFSGGVVKVTTACGTVYTRSTLSNGTVNDPGFPYGTHAVCVSGVVSGITRKLVIPSVVNKTYPVTNVTYNIGTNNASATTGACP